MTGDSTRANAERAAGILRESAPRTPVEQAALTVINDGKWVLWHAHDRDLAVMLLLSRAGLLRDREHEQRVLAADISNARAVEKQRVKDGTLIVALTAVLKESADRLDRGDAPADVAARLRAAHAQAGQRR